MRLSLVNPNYYKVLIKQQINIMYTKNAQFSHCAFFIVNTTNQIYERRRSKLVYF